MTIINFEDYEALRRCTENYTHKLHRRCKRFEIISIIIEAQGNVNKKEFDNVVRLYKENVIDY